MKGAKAIWFCCIIALIAVVGIIGMLLSQDSGDTFYFVLASIPVIAGCLLLRRQRPAQERR